MNIIKKSALKFMILWFFLITSGGSFLAFVVLKHSLQVTAKSHDLVFDMIASSADDLSVKREASAIAYKTESVIYVSADDFSWSSSDKYDYPLLIKKNSERVWFFISALEAGYHLKKGKYTVLFIVHMFDLKTALVYIAAILSLCLLPLVLIAYLSKNGSAHPEKGDLLLQKTEDLSPLLQKENDYVETSSQYEQDVISGEQADNDNLQDSDTLKINAQLSKQKINQDYSQINRLLSDLVRVKDHLLIDVNQKLKAPLSRIKLAADFLDGEASLEIQKDVKLMQKIIEDVFKTFRTAYTSDALKIENIDLLYFFNGLRQKQRIDRSMLLLKIDQEKTIKADRRLFTILIGNLLDNAFYHAKDSGQPVTVLCETDNGITAITIRNHGPAIPVDDIPYIFDPFYQVKNVSKTEETKTGLGLTLCKRIADLHGFDITVLSSEEFTDFVVSSGKNILLLT